MQYQMSGAPVPSVAPEPRQPLTPGVVRPVPRPPKAGPGALLGVLVLVAIVAGALYWVARRPAQSPAAGSEKTSAASEIRTAKIQVRPITRRLRLTGTTGAEHFAGLVSPRMRGSRGSGSRSARDFRSNQNIDTAVSSNARSSGGGSSPSSPGSSGVGSASGSIASTAGSSGGGGGGFGASAMRSATTRVPRGGGSSSGRSSGSSAGAAGAAASATLGAEGLGSTASSLSGGSGGPPSIGSSSGGGGGGGGEFNLTLQELIKPGSYVKKGQVVAEYDRQYMVNRLDDYRASVAQSEASFKKMLAELDVARKAHAQKIGTAKAELEKSRLDVKATPVLSAMESERIHLAGEEAEASYKQLLNEVKFVEIGFKSQTRNAEIELQQAQIELKRAEANVDRMVMKAPIDGLTVMQSIFRGGEFAQIKQGDQLYPGMMFMQIVDPSSMIINASVSQADVEQMRIGLKAAVRFDAFPDLQLPAHVVWIGAMAASGSGGFFSRSSSPYVKEVPVRLKLDKLDPRVIPDLSVSVDLMLEHEAKAVAAPLNAVFRDSRQPAAYVFVKAGDRWERRQVELGIADNLVVAVRQGVKPGEIVALDQPPPGANPT